MEFLEEINKNFFFFSLPLAMFLYSWVVTWKRSEFDDEFFQFNKDLGRKDYLNKLYFLSEKNKENYDKEIEKIEGYFKDNYFTEKEQEKSDEIVIHAYFDDYKKPWAAIRKADHFLLIILLWTPVYCYHIIWLFFVDVLTESGVLEFDTTIKIQAVFLTFILGYVVVLMTYGFFSVGLNILRFIRPKKGSITKAVHIIDSHLRTFNPFYWLGR